jgi:hypothetical protein
LFWQTDSLEELFEAVGRRAGYGEAQLVMTLDGNRVYKSTTPETLGIYDGAELGESLIFCLLPSDQAC